MRIAVGSDHAGFALRRALQASLAAQGHAVDDCGCPGEESCDYPDYAARVAEAVAAGKADRGILVCGTGIGMSMAANRRRGVRAALVHDRFTARMSREHNDANVLCLGARVLDERHAVELAHYWMTVEFEGGRHKRRTEAIDGTATALPGPDGR